MAELMFKRGPQTNLPAIGVDGCFYLTTDTNRLYVGQGSNNAPVLLNQTVQIVASVSDLPPAPPAMDNDFFYCVDENVLAIYRDNKWNQINTNTNDTIKVTNIVFDDGELVTDEESNKNIGVQYKLTLSQTKKDVAGAEQVLDDIEANLFLDTELIAGIVPESATVGLITENTDDGAKIKTTGSGSDNTVNVNIIPGNDNITVKAENDNVKISAQDTLYSVSTVNHETEENSKPSIELLSSEGSKDYIDFGVGNDDLLVRQNNDSIIYEHKTYTQSSVEVNADTDNSVLEQSGNFEIITGIDVSNGHIEKITTKTYQLPFDTYVEKIDHPEDWKAGVYLNIEGQDPMPIDFSLEAKQLKDNLEKYIKDSFEAANTALTYKGIIDNYSDLASKTSVEVGDIYMLAAAEEIVEDKIYHAGDLFIAISTLEGDTGIIDASNLKWEHVPSGNEFDTHFTGIAAIGTANTVITDAERNGSLSYYIKALKNEVNGADLTPADNNHFEIIAGNDLEIIDASKEQPENPSQINPITRTAQIRHKDITTTLKEDSLTAPENHKVISSLTIDNGHITGYTETTVTDNVYTLSGAENEIRLKDTNGAECGEIGVNGDTWINIGIDGNTISVAHNNPDTANTTTVEVTNAEGLEQLGDLEILTKVIYDSKGHIVDVQKETLQLPQDTTYELLTAKNMSGNKIENICQNPYIVLKDVNGAYTYTQLNGHNNIEITGASNKVDVQLVWGTF